MAINPLSSVERIDETLSGTVKQRLDAGHYRYLRVDPPARRPVWVVVMNGRQAAVTDRVRVRVFGKADGFVSRRLGRTFERLRFGSLLSVESNERTSR